MLAGGDEPPPGAVQRLPSCLALLPVGFAWPGLSPDPPVVSYTTFAPLPTRRPWPFGLSLRTKPGSAVCFCGTVRRVTPPGR
jgi:hypothetical protein